LPPSGRQRGAFRWGDAKTTGGAGSGSGGGRAAAAAGTGELGAVAGLGERRGGCWAAAARVVRLGRGLGLGLLPNELCFLRKPGSLAARCCIRATCSTAAMPTLSSVPSGRRRAPTEV
jgi:hypothetical protein